MKTRKKCIFSVSIFLVLLLVLGALFGLFVCFKSETSVIAHAETQEVVILDTDLQTYSADDAKYSQHIKITIPKTVKVNNNATYTDGAQIKIETERGDGCSIGKRHGIWTLTYYEIVELTYKEVGKITLPVFTTYKPIERIVAVCAEHGGDYYNIGDGLYYASYANAPSIYNGSGDSPKTVSEYCSGTVADNSLLRSVTATKDHGGWSTKGINITDEGTYNIRITTVAFQNEYMSVSSEAHVESVTSGYFSVDKTGPKINLSDTQDGFTSGNVDVTYSDATGASATFVRSDDKNYPSSSVGGTDFSSGKSFTAEGNYLVIATDGLDNSNRKKFTIDKTAPELTLNGVKNGGAANGSVKVSWDNSVGGVGKQRTNSDDVLTVKYSYSESYSPPDTAETELASATTFDKNGSYRVTITDKAGNSTAYTFIIDTVAPTITEKPNEYLNHSFVFSAKDGYSFKGIEYIKDGGNTLTLNSGKLSVSLNASNYGVWKFRAYDSVGNYTDWYTANLYYRTEFGNSSSIYNDFYLPAYYVVTLPAKTFDNISGRYTFADYSSAFDWSYKKEWEFRVVVLGNNKWSYVNIANESVHQVYTDQAELNTAVSKYAASYVSDRAVMSASGGSISNPTDSNGITRGDALTEQLSVLPSHLSEYSELPYMLARYSYEFNRPVNGVSENTSSASIKFVSDGISKQSGPEIKINYGETLKSVLDAASAWRQGYYLVTETDRCGNIEKYVLCVDTGEPTLSANAKFGNGVEEDIEFNKAFAEQHYGTMRYLSLDFKGLNDSIDDFVMLNINGRGLDNVKYVCGDEFPVLNYENGYYGDYSITVYDRSLNILQFNVRIAGIAPSVSYTSLTNETKCTLTISLNDVDNALSEVNLYKVAYDGEYTKKVYDDDGTQIDVQSLVYVLRTGGKYVLEFTDMYGREVVTEPIFYMKGLPAGTLYGVKAGGLTNKDVGFSYDASCSVNLYAWQGGAWIMVNDLMQITDGESSCKAEISAGPGTSYKFKYFLYVTEDMNLFTEYGFEIDCIPPQIDIRTVDGTAFLPDTVTPESFYLNWAESGYSAYYYNKSSTLGSLGRDRYTKETIIDKAGTYVFEISDAAKNVTEFSVTLDNVVSWTLDSPAYIRLDDGSYITKHDFTLTVNERTSVWDVTSNNDFKPVNGQKIELDGTYSFHIEDAYGNPLDIVLIVDNLPPVAVITASDGTVLSPGSRTNKAFAVSCEEDNVAITYSFSNGAYAVYDGSLIDEEGVYGFKLTDRMGNISELTVIIDRGVNFSVRGSFVLRGKDYYSRTWLSVSVDEGYGAFTVTDENGFLVNTEDKLEIEGVYTVYIEDAAGNTKTFKAVIDKSAPKATIKTIGGDEIEYGGTVIGAFLVFCEEPDIAITYAKGSGSYSKYDGSYLNGVGTYSFTVTDFLGNTETFTVKVDLDVDFVVGGTYVQDLDGNYISKSWLSITMREEYNRLVIESDSGEEFSEGVRLSDEGEYRISIEDINGNTVSIVLIIDRTAPNIELIGVENGKSTQSDVQLNISEYSEAYFRIGDSSEKFKLEEGRRFTDEGSYTVSARDIAGNEAFVTFTIDKSVMVTPSRELFDGQIITGDISFTFGETVSTELFKNESHSIYTQGKIAEAGEYKLIVNDELGNVEIFEWRIILVKDRSFEFEIPECYSVSVLRGGSVVASAVEDNKVKLIDNGNYILYFEDAEEGNDFYLELTVDNVAPAVHITQNKKYVSITDPSKEGLTYKLFKDGKEVAFKMGDNITAVGDYRLEITDAIGNTAVYSFELHYINTAGILLICLACAVVFVGIIVVVIVRIRQRIR